MRKEDVKSFRFAQWLTQNHKTEEINESVGAWWKEKLKFFDEKIWPTHKNRRGIVQAVEFLEKND